MFSVKKITRENVKKLLPYKSARSEFFRKSSILLDANENPYNNGVNRYPDPYQSKLKQRISHLKNIQAENIFLGNGSDEVIDLLFRAFCEPGRDKTILLTPTYRMYDVAAEINAVEVIRVPLTLDFRIDYKKILPLLSDPQIKLVFICSPNNPTGNLMDKHSIRQITQNFKGLVVVDEAYIDFAPEGSILPELKELPNLVILYTLSKAWGMAGIRLGMAFTHKEVINVLNKIKPPYNINVLTQKMTIEKLGQEEIKNKVVNEIIGQRQKIKAELEQLENVITVYPSDANFLLVQFADSGKVYNGLVAKGIIVRDRTSFVEGCLRITIGTPYENERLINGIKYILYEKSTIY
jgi:histidinol-phosphate aminotransferase